MNVSSMCDMHTDDIDLDDMIHGRETSMMLSDIEYRHQELLQKQQEDYITDLLLKNYSTPIRISSVIVNSGESISNNALQSYLDATIFQATNFHQLIKQSDILHYRLVGNGLVENMVQTMDTRGTIDMFLHNDNMFSTKYDNNILKTISILDIIPTIQILPVKKFLAKTGTNIGNGEGDGYIQFQWRNILGGGEKFTFDATKGTKTRSSYLLNYTQPLSPWWMMDTSIFKNARQLGNSELLLRGLKSSLRSGFYGNRLNYEFHWENLWRTTRATHQNASDSLLFQAGDDFKSSVCSTISFDSRDNSILASKGSLVKLINELAVGNFFKTTLELSQTTSWFKDNFITASYTFKSGYISNFHPSTKFIHMCDKFHNGGSNDVRGFEIMGLGPKDLHDSVGGDAFLAYGVSVFSRLPIKKWSSSNFRLHWFFNGGRLINNDNQTSIMCMKTLLHQHSLSTGIGLVFHHPIARFELNFTLPISAHSNDIIRKGFQYGIGLSFL